MKMTALEAHKKYARTPKGILTVMYRNMRRNKLGISFTLKEFHQRYLQDSEYQYLVNEWRKRGFKKVDKPSLDRKNCKKGYTFENTQMMTWEENEFKRSALDGKLGRKPAVLQLVGNKVIKRFQSQRHVVKEMGVNQGSLSDVLRGKRKSVGGYNFIYETQTK